MDQSSGDPDGVAGFLVDSARGAAVGLAGEVDVGDSYDEVGEFVFVVRERGAGGETDFGDANAILDEENLLGGAGRRGEVGGGGVSVVAEKLDDDGAEGFIGEIAGRVREAAH